MSVLTHVFDKKTFPPPSTLTCARCDESFDPKYNTLTSCKLPHDEIDRIHNTKDFTVAIGLSITFGLGWGFGFLTTSHDLLPVTVMFQVIFIIIVGMQGVLLLIFHGIRNSEAQTLWRNMFYAVSRKTRKVYSLTQSTNERKTSKHTSITASLTTDMGCHSFGHEPAEQSCERFVPKIIKMYVAMATGPGRVDCRPATDSMDDEQETITHTDS